MFIGCLFLVKIIDFVFICGESENRGVLMSFKVEYIDIFRGGRGKKIICFFLVD